ncbi:hypothetical protein [Epilithonimonas xixisoli]|uniref:Uncharacterized protein n=1 Tax=Epilithonimonas xixisoli TaxID=1476462 RepID=A0A4R8I4W7_9FLAO|nr:hypothetical protein [Epilithonimonas xixisoli]TDX83323.1 hypothetical protein B0I22_3403 [Epilithonimonas xixisoli]
MRNLIIDGANHRETESYDYSKVKEIITDFGSQNLVCGFLQSFGNPYNVTVTAMENGCFTWVFSRNGKVVSMQSIQAQKGQSYNAYSSDGITVVGINCDCYF